MTVQFKTRWKIVLEVCQEIDVTTKNKTTL